MSSPRSDTARHEARARLTARIALQEMQFAVVKREGGSMAGESQGTEPWRPGIKGMARLAAWAGALALILAFLAFGWVEARHEVRWDAPRDTVRIAVPSTPHAGLLHIAAAQGYFADEGLDVTISPVSHGKAALDQLALGKADLASAAEVPFVISVLQGEALSVAATVVNAAQDMAIIGRRDRGILVPRDLNHKKVGVSLGTSGEYFLWAFLIRHRLSPEAITWVDVAPPHLSKELASGTVDAIATWEPIKTAAMATLGANAVPFAEGDAYTVTHIIVGRTDYLKAQSTAMQKLLRALLKAESLVRTDPVLARNVVARQLKIAPSALAPLWNELSMRVDLRQSQLVTLEEEARWAMARGYAPPGPLPNFLSRFHLDALLALSPERVTVVR